MEFLKQYEVLYKKAKADLKAAKILLENFEDGVEELDLETIMFHLQQCAEKLLKSLLAYNKIHFTKTHDIRKLLNEIKQNDIKLNDDYLELINLTYYSVEGRYAIIHDDLEDANKYIKILEKLSDFVKKQIKSNQ
jgi:HEPN domain-containing protein